MAADINALRERVMQLRAQAVMRPGAWRIDLAQALLARMDAHAGPARQALLARVAGLLEADAAEPRAHAGDSAATAPMSPPPVGTGLAALAVQLQALQRQRAGQAPAQGAAIAASTGGPPVDAAGVGVSTAPVDTQETLPGDEPGVPAPLPLLEASRRTWARLRNESQLRRSLDQLDEDSGPLNSGRLVHRALSLMHQCAPGYLEHFVAYADALSSLEALRAAALPEPRATTAAGARPRARKRKVKS